MNDNSNRFDNNQKKNGNNKGNPLKSVISMLKTLYKNEVKFL